MSTQTHTEDIDHDGITLLEGKRGRRGGTENPKFLHNKAILKLTQIGMDVA